jgi:transcriptional regulator with XRE-family HTH domain
MQARELAAQDAPARDFGRLLRHWRLVRRYSQLDLAGEASVSSRHLCFLENGRAQPSRDMVQVLGAALDLPLEAQNDLHLAAGFVPPFGDQGWAAVDFEHVRDALDFILKQQQPLPAIVIDGRWDVRMRNEASRRIFGVFHKTYDMDKDRANNAMHVVFHPRAARFIVNWADFAGRLVQILHARSPRAVAAAKLRDEILVYPGVPAAGGTAKPTVLARDDDAAAQGRSQSRFLLDVHDICHAARGGTAAAEDRMLLSGQYRDRRESP